MGRGYNNQNNRPRRNDYIYDEDAYTGYEPVYEEDRRAYNAYDAYSRTGSGRRYEDEYDDTCDTCGEWREVPEKPEETIVYGDADGDGEITTMDVIVLQQFTSGVEVTVDEVAADADGDGEITTMDVIVLQQYTSGWDVELG